MGQSSSPPPVHMTIVSSIKQRGVTKVHTKKMVKKGSGAEHLVPIVHRYTHLIVRSGLLLLLLLQSRAAV